MPSVPLLLQEPGLRWISSSSFFQQNPSVDPFLLSPPMAGAGLHAPDCFALQPRNFAQHWGDRGSYKVGRQIHKCSMTQCVQETKTSMLLLKHCYHDRHHHHLDRLHLPELAPRWIRGDWRMVGPPSSSPLFLATLRKSSLYIIHHICICIWKHIWIVFLVLTWPSFSPLYLATLSKSNLCSATYISIVHMWRPPSSSTPSSGCY